MDITFGSSVCIASTLKLENILQFPFWVKYVVEIYQDMDRIEFGECSLYSLFIPNYSDTLRYMAEFFSYYILILLQCATFTKATFICNYTLIYVSCRKWCLKFYFSFTGTHKVHSIALYSVDSNGLKCAFFLFTCRVYAVR